MVLESIQTKKWKSNFGKRYTLRNIFSTSELNKDYIKKYGISRITLNNLFIGNLNRKIRILEVGSNVGNQLILLQRMGFNNLYGIELQDFAVELSKKRTKQINIIQGSVFDIPFKNDFFDLVFTSGVLIHINPNKLSDACNEIYRTTRKYIWGFEYYANKNIEIVYRHNKNLLWKNDFAQEYLKFYPECRIIKEKRIHYLDSINQDSMFLIRKG